MIPQIFVFAIFGTLSGLIWSWALSGSSKTGMLIGLGVGLLLGLQTYYFGKNSIRKRKLTRSMVKEGYPILAGKLFGLAVISAVITWLIRTIF